MVITLDRDAQVSAAPTSPSAFAELRPAYCLLGASLATALAGAGLVTSAVDGPSAVEIVRPILVVLWAAAGLLLGLRRRHERLAPIVLGGAIVGSVGTLAAAVIAHRSLDASAAAAWDTTLRLAAGSLPAIALHLLLALVDGRLATPIRRNAVIAGYVVGATIGLVLLADREHLIVWPVVLLWLVALVVGLYAAHARYVQAGAEDRRRMQWIGWGMVVAAEATVVIVALHVLTDWPDNAGAIALGFTGFVPVGLACGTLPRMVARVDRLLTHTVALAGLTVLVVAIYVVVILGLGRTPSEDERGLLLWSMVAAGLAALLYLPARRWLTERANRLVYGERVAPDETLRTFGQRLTRSIPMDELLLQLAESLRKSMVLESAEVWTGQAGTLRADRRCPASPAGTDHHRCQGAAGRSPAPASAVGRGSTCGCRSSSDAAARRQPGWRRSPTAVNCSASSSSPGRADGEAFTESEDHVLTELARQVALALHNVQLDAALQASLEELQQRNEELQHSRARIVAAGDAERRKLERNLHDGAQQHLVALAVKLRLAKDAVEDDPADALAMIDEIKGDVQGGDRRAALPGPRHLPAAAGVGWAGRGATGGRDASRRCRPRWTPAAIGRYGADMEAAVYFCVLEALQNAGKHAGDVGIRRRSSLGGRRGARVRGR